MTNTENTKHGNGFSTVAMVLGGYQTGYALVKGTKPDAIERFTMPGSKSGQRMLLPSSLRIMQAAIENALGRKFIAGLIARCVQITAHVDSPPSRISSKILLISHNDYPAPLGEFIAGVVTSKVNFNV